MPARTRVALVVAAAAVAAVTVTVGAVLIQSNEDGQAAERAESPRGAPPLVLDLGVRDDREARDLRRAEQLYDAGRRPRARAIFALYDSVDARIGAALAAWPDRTVPDLQRLVRDEPGSSLAHLNLGFALFWDGRREAAVAQWRAAKRVDPDSFAAVRADDLLHPNFAQGLPQFVVAFEPPPHLAGLPPSRQIDRLQADAARGSARAKLLYGVALQRLGRPLSARRAFDEALAAEPGNVEAQVAAAVGRFEKARPEAAFSRLGPLARRHPRHPSVRFHLGLLLLWIGNVQDAERQLRLVAPETPLGEEAKRLLDRLEEIGRS